MKLKALVATAAGIALALGGSTAAFADDAPPPTDTSTPAPVVSETPAPPVDTPADPAPVVTPITTETTAETTYVAVSWNISGNDASKPWAAPGQSIATHTVTTTINLAALEASDPVACGKAKQYDIYFNDDTTTSLIAGGVLTAPNVPTEHLVPGGSGIAYAVVQGPECHYTPVSCPAQTKLPISTATDPQGWGDLFNATYTADGIDLKATATDKAYAYVDFAAVPLTEMGDLTTDLTQISGTSGVILQDTSGNSIHYDADGTYWTVHAGLFKASTLNGGIYSTKNLGADLISNPGITEVAVWQNPGGESVLHAQNYHCLTQPFGAAAVVVTPPTTKGPQLAFTGGTIDWWALFGLPLIGLGLYLKLRRRTV